MRAEQLSELDAALLQIDVQMRSECLDDVFDFTKREFNCAIWSFKQ